MFTHIGHTLKNLFDKSDYTIKPTESPIEERLYFEFRRWGIFPSTQVVVGAYRVDIMFKTINVVVECDGEAFHQNAEREAKRDAFLISKGYTVVHYTGKQIHHDATDLVYNFILDYFPLYTTEKIFIENEKVHLENPKPEMEKEKLNFREQNYIAADDAE